MGIVNRYVVVSNLTVSRSCLFGGNVLGCLQPLEGFWAPAIAEAAKRLQKRRVAV